MNEGAADQDPEQPGLPCGGLPGGEPGQANEEEGQQNVVVPECPAGGVRAGCQPDRQEHQKQCRSHLM